MTTALGYRRNAMIVVATLRQATENAARPRSGGIVSGQAGGTVTQDFMARVIVTLAVAISELLGGHADPGRRKLGGNKP